jgi:hypothetical protein
MVELEGGSHMDMVDHESAAWPLLLDALSGIVGPA